MPGKILLIEDDESTVELLTVRLRAAGYEVHAASDAMLGVKSAHQLKPDLILLDLKMPAGGGLAVLKGLKSSIHTKQIPVVVVTGADNEMKSKLREYGINTYVQKPFQPEDLLQAVARALQFKAGPASFGET